MDRLTIEDFVIYFVKSLTTLHNRLSRSSRPDRAAFSLVEVCIALGIIAFAVLPLLGLLSIGLDSYHNSVLRSRATQVLNQVAASLSRAAAVTSSTGAPTGDYVALPPLPQPSGSGTPVKWTLAASPTVQTYTLYFDENGTFLNDVTPVVSKGAIPPTNARISAALVVTPPTTKYDLGTAQITVGWPTTPGSGPFYNAPSFSYGSIQGHVDNIITLSPYSGQ